MEVSSAMVTGWLNLGSVLLGIAGWVILVFNLKRRGNPGHTRWELCLVAGLFACSLSLALQIFETYHRVLIGDWSGLEDTFGAVAFAASVLLGITFILSVVTLRVYRNRE